jgi:D-inositol-3-phosphate glycosyltransferase
VPPRNPRALATAVRRLLAAPVLVDGFGVAGRDRAEVRFGWRRVAETTVDSYEQVVSRPAALTDVGS